MRVSVGVRVTVTDWVTARVRVRVRRCDVYPCILVRDVWNKIK